MSTTGRRTVLVTDGEQRAALATVRSLGRLGYRVYVCSSRERSLSGSSRYCERAFTVADPLRAPVRFADDVLRVALATRADVLLPVTEAALLAILPERGRFACAIPFPDTDSFRRICDKREVLSLAPRHGIAAPEQTELPNRGALELLDEVRFPVVLKPIRSVAGSDGVRTRSSVSYAASERELRERVDRYAESSYPILLQERIEGEGFAISVIVWNGELRAAFAHRRLREKPPSGGVSVLRDSIPLDDDLLARSLALLAEFDWNGVAMVEFKRDERTGIPYLMEINGRLWGSLQLAIDAGIDFPSILVGLALGEDPPVARAYPPGVQTRWEWGDVDNLLACLLRPERDLALTSKTRRNRLRSIAGFVAAIGSRARPEIGRRDDFRPYFRETIDWFRGR